MMIVHDYRLNKRNVNSTENKHPNDQNKKQFNSLFNIMVGKHAF
ncbi:MAG: hypothetical protein ACJAUY_000964 [Cognaticolwellia sp.]|jgi:hypothetical protein